MSLSQYEEAFDNLLYECYRILVRAERLLDTGVVLRRADGRGYVLKSDLEFIVDRMRSLLPDYQLQEFRDRQAAEDVAE